MEVQKAETRVGIHTLPGGTKRRGWKKRVARKAKIQESPERYPLKKSGRSVSRKNTFLETLG